MNEPWEEVTLDQVASEITVGHVGPMADEYVDSGVPFLRSLNVERFRINATELRKISREFHLKLKKSALRPGDIVVVRTGKPGSCAVIPDWLPEANCSDVVVVRANRRVRPTFISYVATILTSPAQQAILAMLRNGDYRARTSAISRRSGRCLLPNPVSTTAYC